MMDFMNYWVTGTPVDQQEEEGMAPPDRNNMEVAGLGTPPSFQKSNPNVQYPPFPTLIGEHALLLSKTTEGNAMVTNFRFCVCERRSFINIPLMAIGELVVAEAYCYLKIGCKDGATYSVTFDTVVDCQQCAVLLRQRTGQPQSYKDLFAFRFFALTDYKNSCTEKLSATETGQISLCKPANEACKYTFGKEITRQGFDINKRKIWRISLANDKFEFCSTYPKLHIMPSTIDDEELRSSLDFRAMKRFPSVVWRDKNIGVVLIRSSQPMSSFLGLSYFSNHADVSLLEKIVEACNKESVAIEEDRQMSSTRALMPAITQTNSDGAQGSLESADQTAAGAASNGNGHGASNGNLHTTANTTDDIVSISGGEIGKLAIVDCRSIAGIWGNSLKGGGTEDEVVYKCSIIHLDLANIHAVRDSLNKLRAVCSSYVEGTYLKTLSGSMWLTYIAALLRGANIVVDLMQVKRRPVLVHCSDGWDRTSQICSLSELMMDKYYRTLEGFQVLVEREWLHFGHKFAERGGHDPNCSDTNQQSPIFMQFLDCVYQLWLQYPAEFQFNEAFLVKLLKHSQACLFGTFLHNNEKERDKSDPTASVWALLQAENTQFINLLYKPKFEILTAKYGEHDIAVWKNVYMAGLSPWLHGSHTTDFHMENSMLSSNGGDDGFPRSKSMDDLSKTNSDNGRRNSDPLIIPNSQEVVAASASNADIDTSLSAEVLVHVDADGDSENTDLENGKGEDGDNDGADAASVVVDNASEKSPDILNHGASDINILDTEDLNNINVTLPASSDSDNDSSKVKDSLVSTESPIAQNVTPSCSSVFSDVGESSLSNSEQTLCNTVDDIQSDVNISAGNPENVPSVTAETSTQDTQIQTLTASTDIERDICQSLPSSLPCSSSVSHSVSAPSHIGPQNNDKHCSSEVRSQSSQVETNGTDMVSSTLTNISQSPPSSPHLSSQNSMHYNGSSSLLSERLATTGDVSHFSKPSLAKSATTLPGSMNGNPSLSPSSLQTAVNSSSSDNHFNHSRTNQRGAENVEIITEKLKSSVLLDSDTRMHSNNGYKLHGGSSNANRASNGSKVLSVPCPIFYQNGSPKSSSPTSVSPAATTHSYSKKVDPFLVNDKESGCYSMSDSTDTLVDQPAGVKVVRAEVTKPRRCSKGSPGSANQISPSLNGAARCYDQSSISPQASYSSPSLMILATSPQRKDNRGNNGILLQEYAESPQVVKQTLRARAASGASRDLSVSSTCSVCKGAWADPGRLRKHSGGGGGEVVQRRCIGATVATSTSDISDSFVGEVGNHNNTVAMMERGQKIRQHMDVDGLTVFCDERQDLLGEIVAEKDRKIADLESRLRKAIDIIQANREQQQHHQKSASSHLNGHHANFLEELMITEAEEGELNSLGTVSNAASDSSWENIDESEERIVNWMPDSMVTHCAGCDGEFWVAKWKHHCRNCGKVFCWDCSNYRAPVPHQHLNKPVRVCRRCHSFLLQLSPGASSDGRIPTLVADG